MTFRRFITLLCTAALLVSPLPFAAALHAQTSVYATAGIASYGFTNLYTNSSDISFKGDTGGFGAGVFYNFPIRSRVTVGLDGRYEGSSGYKGGSMAGAALRVGFVPHRNPLRPFVQVGGGFVHSGYDTIVSNGFSTGTVHETFSNGAAQLAFGLDVRLTERLDLRVPEIGAQVGGGNGIKAGVSFLNAGVVYHLGRPQGH